MRVSSQDRKKRNGAIEIKWSKKINKINENSLSLALADCVRHICGTGTSVMASRRTDHEQSQQYYPKIYYLRLFVLFLSSSHWIRIRLVCIVEAQTRGHSPRRKKSKKKVKEKNRNKMTD